MLMEPDVSEPLNIGFSELIQIVEAATNEWVLDRVATKEV